MALQHKVCDSHWMQLAGAYAGACWSVLEHAGVGLDIGLGLGLVLGLGLGLGLLLIPDLQAGNMISSGRLSRAKLD